MENLKSVLKEENISYESGEETNEQNNSQSQ